MKITRILNNNVVAAMNDVNKPVIVIGTGIGFTRKVNDIIDINDIDEVFVLTNKKLFPNIESILVNTPTDLIETTNKIVSYGKRVLKQEINQNIIITLTDHLKYAISSARDGFHTSNPLNWDIKRFYPEEYQIGLYALKIIKKRQYVALSEDEAGFIAMHFVNAIINNGDGQHNNSVLKITKVIKQVLNVVDEQRPGIPKDTVSYARFIRHIQFMAIRLFDQDAQQEALVDNDLKDFISNKYSDEYKIAKIIQKEIHTIFDLDISENELFYITIHLTRLFGSTGGTTNET